MSDEDPPLPQFIGKEEFDALPDGKAADAASKAFKRRVEGQEGFHQAVDQFEKARTDADGKNHAIEIPPMASGEVLTGDAAPRATKPQVQKAAIPKELIPRNLIPTVPRMNVAIAQDKRATSPPVAVKAAAGHAPAKKKPGANAVAIAMAAVAIALVVAVVIILPDGGEKPAPSGTPAAGSGPVVAKTATAPPTKTAEPPTPVPSDTVPIAPTSTVPVTATVPDKTARPPVATTEPTTAPAPSSSGIWVLKKPKK